VNWFERLCRQHFTGWPEICTSKMLRRSLMISQAPLEATAKPKWMSCNISHLREASCKPLEMLHMAFPQTCSSAFLSDCLVAFRRYPLITAFAVGSYLCGGDSDREPAFCRESATR
jgi:hypothetical protein